MAMAPVFPRKDYSEKPNLKHVAELIRTGKAKNIILLAGAGISTASGIPDFRSPKTGLYSNLKEYNLPYPEAIFDIGYFQDKPEAFYTLAKALYPGNFQPTLTHCLFKVLEDKGLLLRCYTQNVDTMERMVGISDDKIIEAHGSFATATCLCCRKTYSASDIKPEILKGNVVRCQEGRCKGKQRAMIKPDIVFFGEGLPARFFQCAKIDFGKCDLLITLGTSLKVHPFASLIDRPDEDCPRLLINLELVGEADEMMDSGMFGRYRESGFDFEGIGRGGIKHARDVAYIGECDAASRELADACGFGEDLDKVWARVQKDFPTQKRTTKADSEDAAKGKTLQSAAENDSDKSEPVEKAEPKKVKTDEVEELAKRIGEQIELRSKD